MTNTPYMSIKDACKATGLSQYYLRNICRSGYAPHIKNGTVYMINVPALLEKLNSQTQTAKGDNVCH